MPIQWGAESSDQRDDPVSGARIIQLTSAAAISNNVYGEQPYTSPDGKRVIIARCHDFNFDTAGSILVHDLPSLKIAMVVRQSNGSRGVFNAAWSGIAHFWSPERVLMRFSLEKLEVEEVYREEDPEAPLVGSTVSPDGRYVAGSYAYTGGSEPIFRIATLDLQTGKREVIMEHPEICNSHLQYNPVHGRQLLVQNNRGVRLQADGTIGPYRHDSEQGTTLFVINADGSNLQYIPVGPPITSTCTGHENFVADTGLVLFSTGWNAPDLYNWSHDQRYPQGNLFVARPGDEKPRVYEAPEHFFNHVSASRCGKYWVADSIKAPGLFIDGHIQSAALIMGSIETGKYRTLVDCTGASGGGNQCTHTHPYITADNGHVIYNADPQGVPNVFAAKIPDGFLASLD